MNVVDKSQGSANPIRSTVKQLTEVQLMYDGTSHNTGHEDWARQERSQWM